MKSAFGSKRKARKIQVDDDDEGSNGGQAAASTTSVVAESPTSSTLGRKSFKKSSLRQSINFDDESQDAGISDASGGQGTNKPSIGRSSSMRKKKASSSRLSFGPGEIISGDAAEALEDDEAFTPKKGLGRRVIETNAMKSRPVQRIPIRDEDDERPTYSKDYLNELKSSTPNTPKDMRTFGSTIEDDSGFDISEADGATVVDMDETTVARIPDPAYIPSEAEIREKKERRSRMAHEQDFISLNDDGRDGRSFDQLSLLPQKKKTETRLVREDEDLGEGFDEFVDDGRISLGKKQEREAKRRQRKEMADMIHQAEGSSDDGSDDSDADVRAAFEAAQTRAGMDGLLKPDEKAKAASVEIPPKITPLPALSECLERLQTTLSTMEQELARRRKKMAELEQEKRDIAAREVEVQELLNQAGQRNTASTGEQIAADLQSAPATSTGADTMVADRGLESFGNTPVARPEVVDLG
ncbi:hypothetical protein BP6252_06990 [Coleophoma cylindrospora]|uniref:Nineteen complex-related protein 2-domain-containing protein n=1 Tax=Coleophoma cylindrospora TaxID=1849047 RepID=A0A3D8RG89_9HELO|nr:hypothetical protein BP6252_06990 [Coleophoma cylindrospora]